MHACMYHAWAMWHSVEGSVPKKPGHPFRVFCTHHDTFPALTYTLNMRSQIRPPPTHNRADQRTREQARADYSTSEPLDRAWLSAD